MIDLTLTQLIDAYIAAHHEKLNSSDLTRLAWWTGDLGARPISELTADEVDESLGRLQRRGRIKARRNGITTLSGATLNRNLTMLGSVFKFARKNRILPRAFVPPTRGIDRQEEHIDQEKYLTTEQVLRLERCARVTDKHWGKLAALIRFCADTGLRIGNVKSLKWGDIDFEARTATARKTKNGDSHVAPLTDAAITALRGLTGSRHYDEYIFGPRGFGQIWRNAVRLAGLPEKVTPHYLRHAYASRLCVGGASLAQISMLLGHRDPKIVMRYAKLSIRERATVVQAALG